MKLRTSAWAAGVTLAVFVTFGCADANRQTAADRPADQQPGDSPAAADRGAVGADHEFVMRAALDSMAEIEMGKLAQERGSTQAVKDYGRKLVEDHTAMNNELKQAVPNEAANMPTELPAEKRDMIDRLSKRNGPQFDREFLNEAVAAHRQAIELFQKEASSGANQALTNWASGKIPMLQEHLKTAQGLQSGKS
jgi:putative membrane protein